MNLSRLPSKTFKCVLKRNGIHVRFLSVDRKLHGFTLIEILIALSIIGILAALGSTVYVGQIKKAKTNLAIADVKSISLDIDAYMADNGMPPDDLATVRHDKRIDPWGNPYRYLRILGRTGVGGMRKDRFLVPLNSDYDLYSMGPDGQTMPPLTVPVSKDDIIRANDGGFVGPAYAY